MPSKKRVGRKEKYGKMDDLFLRRFIDFRGPTFFFPHLRLYHFQPYKGASGMGQGTCVCMVLRLHRPRRGAVGA